MRAGPESGGRALDSAAGSAGQLAGRGGGAADDLGYLRERDGEHVVQDEGQAFGGGQGVQDQQQRGADGVGHQGFAFRVGGFGGGSLREVGQVLAARRPGAQHVQADPGDHRGQPAGQVGYL
jgi:hypothetical protein